MFSIKKSCENGDLSFVISTYEKDKSLFDKEKHKGLYTASANGNIEIVKFLFDKGADIHVENDRAFRFASMNGQLQVVKFLVEKGAILDSMANFALSLAIVNLHLDVVKFLVEKGANSENLGEYGKRFVFFIQKMEEKSRVNAVNKIGSWWIPICYDVNRECGRRMMERSWKRVEEMYEQTS